MITSPPESQRPEGCRASAPTHGPSRGNCGQRLPDDLRTSLTLAHSALSSSVRSRSMSPRTSPSMSCVVRDVPGSRYWSMVPPLSKNKAEPCSSTTRCVQRRRRSRRQTTPNLRPAVPRWSWACAIQAFKTRAEAGVLAFGGRSFNDSARFAGVTLSHRGPPVLRSTARDPQPAAH